MISYKKVLALRPTDKRQMVLVDQHLYVAVSPTGVKTWIFRKTVDGHAVKQSLGRVDKVSLYEARRKRDDLLQKIEENGLTGHAGREVTFAEAAEEWMEKRCVPTTGEKNIQRQRSRLDRIILPVLGSVMCHEVSAALVLNKILRPIEAQGQNDLAHAIKQLIGMILRFGVACEYCERDVTIDLAGALTPTTVEHFPHLSANEEIAELLQKLFDLPPSASKFGLLLCAYTFLRPGEVRGAKWTEINLQKAEWRIPAERMKRRREHIVPLSKQVIDLLEQAKARAANSPFVLPSPRNIDSSISSDAYKSTLRNLGYVAGTVTTHGFRSMASTILNEHEWPADAIERQLSHVEGNKVRAAYNHAQFMSTRVKMMQWYADYLDSLRLGMPEPPVPN